MERKLLIQPVVLAAGKGKRIVEEAMAAGLGDLPKVLYPLTGRPLIEYPLTMLAQVRKSADNRAAADRRPPTADRHPVWQLLSTILVVGYRQDLVRERVGERARYVDQKEMLGTGHAVRVCERATARADAVLVINGDMPAWRPATVSHLIDEYVRTRPMVALGTVSFDDPLYHADFFAYGRIVRDGQQHIQKIVEQKDASAAERALNECNPSLYCFNRDWIFNALDKVTNHNSQGEYYLTDVLEIAARAHEPITSVVAADWREALGVNTLEQLRLAEELLGA